MKIAIYSRISKDSSDNDNQLLLLRDFCRKMNYEIYYEYVDVISGGTSNRPQFKKMLLDASQRKFDMLLFYSLDRFSREGVRKTIQYLQMLDDYGITYKSFMEQYIDSSGIFRDVIISLLATLAIQERIRISDRVKAGLERTRRLNNKIGGRPKIDENKIARIKKLKESGESITAIANKLKISRGSVYNYI